MSTTTENVSATAEIPLDAQRWMVAKAKHVATVYGYSDSDDLLQEAWVWILTSKTGRRGWWADGEFDHRGFHLDIETHMTRSASADRSKAIGKNYDTYGIRYSAKEVTYLLGELWTRGILPQQGNDGPAVSTSVDHSKGPDLPAKIADLSMAYHKAVAPGSVDDQILFRLYGLGYTQTEVAKEMGISQPAVHARKDAAINDIARSLNHTSWGRTWNDPDEWNDGPGSRTAISNSAAAVATSL
jgi:DNA-directed RNA polymerase specialized sigma24 family protein